MVRTFASWIEEQSRAAAATFVCIILVVDEPNGENAPNYAI